MIIGAQKAGTTSLQNYLAQHPNICSARQREIGYFVNDVEYQRGYEELFNQYFDCSFNKNDVLLAKSVWILTMPTAIRRLKQHNPDMHIVSVLRHPIERAYSSYWYARRRGWENRKTFEEAISTPAHSDNNRILSWNLKYLEAGRYVEFLEPITKQFSKEQVHVFLLEDVRSNAHDVCKKIFSCFNWLNPNFEPEINKQYNQVATYRFKWLAQLTSTRTYMKRTKKVLRSILPQEVTGQSRDMLRRLNEKDFDVPPISSETRAKLIEYYAPFNAALSIFLEKDISHWNE
jgi:hypothetical protein